MTSERNLKTTIVIGGAVASTLKSMFGTTERGFKSIGKTIDGLKKKQAELGSSIKALGNDAKGVDKLRESYKRLGNEIDALKRKRISALGDAMRSKGAGMFAGGVGILGGMMAGMGQAKHWEQETAKLRATGVGEQTVKDAQKYALGLKQYGVSQLESLDLTKDALTIFGGDMHHAAMAVPTLAKMKFANSTMYGAESGGERDKAFMDMLRVVELRGGLKDQASFDKQANLIQQIVSATGGKVQASEWMNVIKTGGLAAKGMQDEAFYRQLEPLVQELGGDRVGTGLSSAYAALYQGHMTKRAANNLDKYGLIADKSKVTHDKAGQVSFLDPGALKGADLFRKSQYEWMKQVLLPTLAKKGVTSKDQVLDAIGSIFSNRKGADMMAAMYLQQSTIDKNEAFNAKAANVDQAEAAAKNTPQGKEAAARARMQDAMQKMGENILPVYTKAMDAAGSALEKLNAFMEKNPDLAKGLVIGLGAIGTLATVGGTALMGMGLAAQGLGPAITMIKGVATAIAFVGRALLMNPIGLAITGIALAAVEIYRHWDGLKAWFAKLWDDITLIFKGWSDVFGGLFSGDWQRMVDGVKEIFKGLGDYVADIFGGILSGIKNVLGDAWNLVRHPFGGADIQGQSDFEDAMKSLPIPAKSMAGAARASATPMNVTNTYNITQQPGESSDELAKRITAEQERRAAVKSRGSLTDN